MARKQTAKVEAPEVRRQGDVILIKMSTPAELGKKLSDNSGVVVLAYGEVTGHKHQIRSKNVELFETKEQQDAALALGTRILRAHTDVKLRHEEHDTVSLSKGDWLVRIQREYSPQELRNVAD